VDTLDFLFVLMLKCDGWICDTLVSGLLLGCFLCGWSCYKSKDIAKLTEDLTKLTEDFANLSKVLPKMTEPQNCLTEPYVKVDRTLMKY
jgi:hypothetical protein